MNIVFSNLIMLSVYDVSNIFFSKY